MKTSGTEHLVERTYRESGQFQWVRETLVNALEAGATQVEFGIEWQAVEQRGVYRRTIADNGKGMTAEELVEPTLFTASLACCPNRLKTTRKTRIG